MKKEVVSRIFEVDVWAKFDGKTVQEVFDTISEIVGVVAPDEIVRFDVSDGIDRGMEIQLIVFRPETDEEYEKRIRFETDYEKKLEAKERAEYERLKVKFG